jgi:pimeloyl-[acyl-carrier protein] methyl ester esterase
MSQRLHVRTYGTGKDLVLLHGWGVNSGAFAEFLPYLTEHFRVSTIDLPGYGENADFILTEYSLAGVVRVIANEIPQGAIIAGWSLGGMVAQRFCLDFAEQVSGLITIASSPKFSSGPNWQGISSDLLNVFEVSLARDYKKTLDRFLAIQAMGSDTAKQDIKTIRGYVNALPGPNLDALREGLNLLSHEDLRAEIRGIRQPTLRLYGRLDSLVPVADIERIHGLQPQAHRVIIPHASHAPFISHPQQTAEQLIEFVRQNHL